MAGRLLSSTLFSVNAVGDPEPIIVKSPECRRVIIRENGTPTVDFDLFDRIGGTASRRMLGSSEEFKAFPPFFPFRLNDIAGYVATASGTVDFQQLEFES